MVEIILTNQDNERPTMAEETKCHTQKPHGTTAHMHGGSAPATPPNVTKDNVEMAALFFQMIQVSESLKG